MEDPSPLTAQVGLTVDDGERLPSCGMRAGFITSPQALLSIASSPDKAVAAGDQNPWYSEIDLFWCF
jgi:hypothetical protein